MSSEADRELMADARSGSVEAYGQLYDRYADRAYQVARSVCTSADRAEDAVQAAFISVWNDRASYREQPGTIAAWLLTAVLSSARTSSGYAPYAAAERIEPDAVGCEMRALLSRLPEAQREIITLAVYGRLTHREIAERFQLPTQTIQRNMRLGLDRLQAEMARQVA